VRQMQALDWEGGTKSDFMERVLQRITQGFRLPMAVTTDFLPFLRELARLGLITLTKVEDPMLTRPMEISPKFTVQDWLGINFNNERGWQEAVNIFEDRIVGRFLEPIRRIEGYEFAGFAVLALDCLLIETLQQFLDGKKESTNVRDAFVRFLTQTSFGEFIDEKMAHMFYEQFRNGILHQAEIKGTSRVRTDKGLPLVSFSPDCNGLIVNRKLFHQHLIQEFTHYVGELRKPDSQLRANFKKKMEFICSSIGIYYFAYGANMLMSKITDRSLSARALSPAKLKGYRLVINKKSKDGSGKANLMKSEGDEVWGVLYEMDENDLVNLDRHEGGYRRECFELWTDAGKTVKAFAYISSKLTNSLPTYEYKMLLVNGAREHGLPATYVGFLEQLPSQPE
jgi:gamma-glutamylcyclotransferase